MSEITDLAGKMAVLEAAISKMQGGGAQAGGVPAMVPQQAMAPQQAGYGLPAAVPQQQMAYGLPQPAGMMPAQAGQMLPTGVSVPVTVPLPDGREVSFRVHFGPEALNDLQACAAACLRMFGPYLQARQPYGQRGGWGNGGGYQGGGYNGGYRRGGRW